VRRSSDWENPRVREGLKRMLELRSQRMASGERPIGWKLGFGAPEWLDRFGLSGPLVGFLTDATVQPSGATFPCEEWHRPVAEPELAVYFGRDFEAGSGSVAEAIAGLGAAIEIADVHPPPEDISEVLAGNIFHRGLILGAAAESRAGGISEGLRARVLHNGAEVANTPDLHALTGALLDVVAHSAELLGAAGEKLSAGEILITGSIIPPLALNAGDETTFELAPLAPISVRV
jgi:2-keto-4-pentenoate hydratase